MKLARIKAAWLIVAVAVLPLAAYAGDLNRDVNDIGNRHIAAHSIISMEREVAVGKQYAEQIDKSSKLLKDPVVTEYVNRVEQNIANNSDAKVPITVKIIQDPSINAMTLPGGFMYVNTGLLKVVQNEDELAGVLAHETAHVALRSWAGEMTKQTILQYAMIPLMFTPMSAAVYYGVEEAYMNGVPLAFLKFSRNEETKADFYGIQYLWKAGYDPNGLIDSFGLILQEARRDPNSVPSVFMDHPPTPDRIIKAEAEIKSLPKKDQFLVDTSGFDAMKARFALDMNNQMRFAKNQNHPTLRRRTDQTDGTSKNGQSGDDKPPVLKRRD